MAGRQTGVDEFMTENTSLSEQILFAEYDDADLHIRTIVDAESSKKQKDEALACLRKIFDNYLECPTLLDRYVAPMVTTLMESARAIIYKENLSDRFGLFSHSLSAIYALSKVRGRKSVQKFLSHEVEDIEPVLQALQNLAEESSKQDQNNVTDRSDEPQMWESLYMLWNWLGTLSLVPFDCKVVLADSTLFSSFFEVGRQHLSHAGPTREAAAACLASWLSRPDLEKSELPQFVHWSRKIVQDCCSSRYSQQTNIFLVLGTVQSLVTILKISTSPRENLLEVMEPLWDPFIALAESNLCESNLLLRKFMVKWWSRMGCAYLPPRVASWRYQRGRRSLAENLKRQKCQDDTTHASIPDDSKDELRRFQNVEGQLPDIPVQVEDAMGFIIQGLADPSTVVRWSAAKGTGRLTNRLPSICADDVLDAILDLFTDVEKDTAWHGACLALAELARRGLLLPHRLAEVVPLIVRAIQYDLRRGQTSVGAHVRDAACYTYWAFARAYAPSILKPYIPELSESIILTCLFDREVNCRRAASAAFQECVGRQGADNFKHGISILTTADYFSLGNRSNAFTTIAFHVAQFPEYRRKIINHVYRVKLFHWDASIRDLSSRALYGLTSFDKNYVATKIVPSLLETSLDPKNIPIRHGSMLGLGEAVLALRKSEGNIEGSLPKGVLNEIAEIVPTIEKKRLYRGRGGEIVRKAVCRLIRCICDSEIPMVARQQVRLLDSIDASLPHPNESIQGKACEALLGLTCNYFPVGQSGPSDRLQKRIVDKYIQMVRTSDNPASTRGFALALGFLPPKLLAPSAFVLDSVLDCLCTVSRYDTTVGKEKDAETRRNALIALRRGCQTVGIHSRQRTNEDDAWHAGMTHNQVLRVFDAFFAGLQDYNVDRRGDVGSWCRIEAMKGLETLTILIVEQCRGDVSDYFSAPLCTRLVGALLKQFSEKLDAARVQAGKSLQRILTKENPGVPYIPEKSYLLECLDLSSKQSGEDTTWADSSVTFPMAMKALEISDVFPEITAGMVISIGGLTESVAKHSCAALLKWAKINQGSDRINDLGNVLLDLFKTHSREGRVILPLLKTIDVVLSHQCLDDILLEESSEFGDSLLTHLFTETRNCNDVHRLFASIDVALGLVNTTSQSQNGALGFACAMLSHQFPRVRKYAAEQVYVSLLENIELVQKDESILEYLLEAPWDADMNALQCREMAEKVSNAVGVTLPDIASSTGEQMRKKMAVRDDFASYAALVQRPTD